MSFCPNKTKLLYVGVPQLVRTLPSPLPSATMLGTEIKPVTVAKGLGVYIYIYIYYIHTEKYSPKSYVVNFRTQISSC